MLQRRTLLGLTGAVFLNPALGFTQPPPGGDGFAADRVPPVLPASAGPLAVVGSPVPVTPADRVLTPSTPHTLEDLIRVALERNPRLARAAFTVDASRGRTVQAGLYPNPVLSATADELGDRQGRAGILTIPQVSQEIVTGGKLALSQAVAARETDQATLGVLAERYRVIGSVRGAYFEAAALHRRADFLKELFALAEQSAARGKELQELGNLPQLDLLQLELERERVRAEHESAVRELPGALARLAAAVGVPRLPDQQLLPAPAALDLPLPEYDLGRAREAVAASHPDIRAAKLGIDRARLAHERARAEPIPNVTVTAGYVRQNQNRSNDFMVGVSLPVPVWNRNEGNILAAQAEVGAAVQEMGRVETELLDRLATAYRAYAPSKRQAELYGTNLIPRAEETFRLLTESVKVKGGPFEYLRVIQAQRALTEARVAYARSLGEAWRAAGEISGLLLEEQWPPLPPTKP